MKLKYQKEIEEIVAELHQSWMNDAEKREFNRVVLRLYGKKLNDDIEAGVKAGHSVERQIEIAKETLKVKKAKSD